LGEYGQLWNDKGLAGAAVRQAETRVRFVENDMLVLAVRTCTAGPVTGRIS